MSNLKEIRTRITSIQSTQKITSAMKLVSASKLRHAQTDIVNLRPYSEKLNEILCHLADEFGSSEDNPLFTQRKPKNVLLILFSSNRGLCGAFNSNLIKEIDKIVNEKYIKQKQDGTLKLICFGKKAAEQLQKNYEIIEINESLIENPHFEEVDRIATGLMNDFIQKKTDKIEIIYNRFVNPATQIISVENYLPVAKQKMEPSQETTSADFIFQPSQEEIANELIPKILKLQLYKALLDSVASEHGARMTSMAKATDNAIEMLRELRLKYNNARQADITNELNEIVCGAEALKN
jgi:F-type H+-transporting ATPase subunit gamma